MRRLDLSAHVQAIEAQIDGLDAALREQDSAQLEQMSSALHRALADALLSHQAAQQAGSEPLPQELRSRLMLAQTRAASLQQVLHFASSSIERTLAVLLPRDESAGLMTSSKAGPRTAVATALNAYKG